MQSVQYLTISEGDLLMLFGIGKPRLNAWLKAGLPRRADGRYLLTEVCRWVVKHQRDIEQQKVTLSNVTQQDLISLTGKSRQTIFDWTRAGMPRNPDKSYNLSEVIRWIRNFYDCVYKVKHQRIAKRASDLIYEMNLKKVKA